MARLAVRYKKHSKQGQQGKVRMLVVLCPIFGKTCAVKHVCVERKQSKPPGVTLHRAPCKYYGGVEFGYVICNHPKAR